LFRALAHACQTDGCGCCAHAGSHRGAKLLGRRAGSLGTCAEAYVGKPPWPAPLSATRGALRGPPRAPPSTRGALRGPLELRHRRGGRFAAPLELRHRRGGRFAAPLELPHGGRTVALLRTAILSPRFGDLRNGEDDVRGTRVTANGREPEPAAVVPFTTRGCRRLEFPQRTIARSPGTATAPT
jgi:hypothetical protein